MTQIGVNFEACEPQVVNWAGRATSGSGSARSTLFRCAESTFLKESAAK
jgi:hypothetical protein